MWSLLSWKEKALAILLWAVIFAVLTAILSVLVTSIWYLVTLVFTGLAIPGFWKAFLVVWGILLLLTEIPFIGFFLFIEAEAMIRDIRLRRLWREKKRVAEARSRKECSEEEAIEIAKRAAELNDQEGLGEIKVVTDQEE